MVLTEDEVGDLVSGFSVELWDGLGVHVQREGDCRVAEACAHSLGVDSCAKGKGRIGMAEIM